MTEEEKKQWNLDYKQGVEKGWDDAKAKAYADWRWKKYGGSPQPVNPLGSPSVQAPAPATPAPPPLVSPIANVAPAIPSPPVRPIARPVAPAPQPMPAPQDRTQGFPDRAMRAMGSPIAPPDPQARIQKIEALEAQPDSTSQALAQPDSTSQALAQPDSTSQALAQPYGQFAPAVSAHLQGLPPRTPAPTTVDRLTQTQTMTEEQALQALATLWRANPADVRSSLRTNNLSAVTVYNGLQKQQSKK
jgi:hypothetical protein